MGNCCLDPTVSRGSLGKMLLEIPAGAMDKGPETAERMRCKGNLPEENRISGPQGWSNFLRAYLVARLLQCNTCIITWPRIFFRGGTAPDQDEVIELCLRLVFRELPWP